MIRPNVRVSFGRKEAELLLALAGPGAEERLRSQGIDGLLDDVSVFRAFLQRDGVSAAPAPLVFYLLVRHAFLAREIHDRRLADYTAALLLEFGKAGRAHQVPGSEDREFRYLADILAELELARGEREFHLRMHLGNLALWMGGLFPDHITHRVQRRGAPPLSYYDELGASGFRSAAGMQIALRHDLGDVLVRAADDFTSVRSALNTLSDAFLFPRPKDPVDRLLREVRDSFEREWGG
jgi:hypothetical protein